MPQQPPPSNSLTASGRLTGFQSYRQARPYEAPDRQPVPPLLDPIGPPPRVLQMPAIVETWQTLTATDRRRWNAAAVAAALSPYHAFLRENLKRVTRGLAITSTP